MARVLYTAEATVTGGRANGHGRTSDGALDVQLRTPKEMGGDGGGTNPEQLFAAGWSACFLGAVKIVAGKRKVMLPAGTAIDAEVDLRIAEGAYFLKARLNVSLPGLAHEVAQALADEAHQTCPYSKATRGNIDVAINVVNSQLTNRTEEIHQ
jgi:Ohr subfamily peroxiredoxin